MTFLYKGLSTTLFSVLLSLTFLNTSSAHIMVAQHGTLNIIDNKAFMVLSLPVSALQGIDDDKDGKLSKAEFKTHRATISKIITKNVVLTDAEGVIDLEDMILSPVMSHYNPKEPASQLVVMGKYTLKAVNSSIQYRVNLYGSSAKEQSIEVTATHKASSQKNTFELTSAAPVGTLFPAKK